MFLEVNKFNLKYINLIKNLYIFLFKDYICFCYFFDLFYLYVFLKKVNKFFNYYFFSYYSYFFFSKYINNFVLYFNEFFLDGLYYRVKYYKHMHALGFIIGYNHYILYKLPLNIFCKLSLRKRGFFLYSVNKLLLGNISSEIVELKYPNLFKGRGIKNKIGDYRKKNIVKKKK